MIVKCIIRHVDDSKLNYSWWYDVTNVAVKELNINGNKYFRFFVTVVNHVSKEVVGEFEAHNFYTVDKEEPLEEKLKKELIL